MLPIIVSQVAASVGISANLLYAVCLHETGFKNVSNYNDPHNGSYGICQINLDTAREIMPYVDRLALMQIRVNLEIAGLYLKKLSNKYNNISHVLAAYNAGHVTYVDGTIRNHRYIDKVMNIYSKLNN